MVKSRGSFARFAAAVTHIARSSASAWILLWNDIIGHLDRDFLTGADGELMYGIVDATHSQHRL